MNIRATYLDEICGVKMQEEVGEAEILSRF